jgi:Cu2+-exporting ATPase
MVALGDQLAGIIELEPTLRPEVETIIQDLHRRDKEVYIISGDQEEPTRRLAERLGIDHYFANTLPEDKAGHVERLQAAGRTVCFVGDGINDSIALKKAQVSVSLRGATSVATDTAQVVLMDMTLNHLPTLFDLAAQFDTNMKLGFAAAIIPGFFIIGGVFLINLGIVGSLAVYNVSLLTGIGVAMLPLLQQSSRNKQVTDRRTK